MLWPQCRCLSRFLHAECSKALLQSWATSCSVLAAQQPERPSPITEATIKTPATQNNTTSFKNCRVFEICKKCRKYRQWRLLRRKSRDHDTRTLLITTTPSPQHRPKPKIFTPNPTRAIELLQSRAATDDDHRDEAHDKILGSGVQGGGSSQRENMSCLPPTSTP